MTVSSTPSEISYAGDGVTTVFAIPFVFDTPDDLKVIETDSSGNPVEVSTGFAITGGGGGTGTLTRSLALPVDTTLTILDDPELTQPVDYINNDPFPAETHEGALDRTVRQVKRLYELIQNSLRVADGDPSSDAGTLLGSVDNRKGKYLFFNAVTGAIEYAVSIATTTLTQSILGLLLNPQTSAESGAGVVPSNYWYLPGDLRRYGAVPDGSTSCSAAWIKADAQAAAGGSPILVPRTPLAFATSVALTVDYRSDVVFEPGAVLNYTGSSNIVVLTIGDTTHFCFARRYENLCISRSNQSNWSSESSIGVRIYAATGCFISTTYIQGHTIGLQTLPAGGNGFQHNEVFLGQFLSNKIGLDISNVTGGYTNENTFYDGRFTVFSGTNSSTARYGIRCTSSDASYLFNNNNVFMHPSFELNAPDASAEAVPILMVHGQQNKFLYCRDEINDTPFARESNAAIGNWYDVGYFATGAPPVVESAGTAANYKATNSGLGLVFSGALRKVFDSGPMHKRWNNYDGAGGAIFVRGVHVGFSGSGATVFGPTTNITPNAAYLDITSGGGFGVFVNTNEVKDFVVSRQCESGRGGRIVVVCYDAIDGGGSIIATAGSVLGSSGEPFSSIAGYGGAFSTGGDTNNDVYFRVTSAVKSVRILVTAGTSSLRIREFSVWSLNAHSSPGYVIGLASPYDGEEGLANAVPTSGTYGQGHRLWNPTVAAGGSPGWICTTGGTPGTWKAMANVAA